MTITGKDETIKETMNFKFHIDTKSVTATKNDGGLSIGCFVGLASVYDNKDLQGDIVEKGAFKRTLNNQGNIVPILWQHDPDNPIGVGRLEDSEKGLVIKGELNLDVPQGKAAYALVKQGALKGLSIGYDVKQEDYTKKARLLKELQLWEVSLVTFAANPLATVLSVKSVTPYSESLPMAQESQAWDSAEAKSRVKQWASNEKGELDFAKYTKAFMWHDVRNENNEAAYKYPFCDVIDGKLTIIPGALKQIAATLQGAKNSIPSEDSDRVKGVVAKYYKKLNRVTPWDMENKSAFELGLYSIVGMAEPMEKKELSESQKELVSTVISILSELKDDEEEETDNDDGCTCGCGNCTCQTPAPYSMTDSATGKPSVMVLSGDQYDMGDADFVGQILNLLSKIRSADSDVTLDEKDVSLLEDMHAGFKALYTALKENKSNKVNNMVDKSVQVTDKVLTNLWSEYMSALKAYGEDMDNKGKVSKDTQTQFKELNAKIDTLEGQYCDSKTIWTEFMNVLDEYGAEIKAYGAASRKTMDKLEFIAEKIEFAEKKAASETVKFEGEEDAAEVAEKNSDKATDNEEDVEISQEGYDKDEDEELDENGKPKKKVAASNDNPNAAEAPAWENDVAGQTNVPVTKAPAKTPNTAPMQQGTAFPTKAAIKDQKTDLEKSGSDETLPDFKVDMNKEKEDNVPVTKKPKKVAGKEPLKAGTEVETESDEGHENSAAPASTGEKVPDFEVDDDKDDENKVPVTKKPAKTPNTAPVLPGTEVDTKAKDTSKTIKKPKFDGEEDKPVVTKEKKPKVDEDDEEVEAEETKAKAKVAKPAADDFTCEDCGKTFDSQDELDDHKCSGGDEEEKSIYGGRNNRNINIESKSKNDTVNATSGKTGLGSRNNDSDADIDSFRTQISLMKKSLRSRLNE